MNVLTVWAPRWHDRTVLLAPWKVGNHNEIRITHKNFPEPFYMSGERIRSYPKTKVPRKNQVPVEMYVVPLADLMTMNERNDIVTKEKEIEWQTSLNFQNL